MFQGATSIKVELNVQSIQVSGQIARVRGSRKDTMTTGDNKPSRFEGSFEFVLARTTSGWHIQKLN
jgi:ketosteroid isomerase-like protein